MSISNSPGFSFNPATMQAGTTYYTATVAGENLNGNVNLNGDCLDSPSGIQLIQATSLTVANCTCN